MPSRLKPASLLFPPFVTLLVPVLILARQSGSDVSGDQIFAALHIQQGMTVCEIGAGDGSLSMAAARLVGPQGRVYSSELGDSRVASLRQAVKTSGLAQITVVEGAPSSTNFPDAACDTLFMRNVYHHFDDPSAMNASIRRALKSGGRVGIADFTPRRHEADRPQDRDGENGTHGVSAEAVERELKDAGLVPVSTYPTTDEVFLLVFEKAGPK